MKKVTNTYFKKEPLVLMLVEDKGLFKYPQRSYQNLLHGEFVIVKDSQIGDEILRMKKKGHLTVEEVEEPKLEPTLPEITSEDEELEKELLGSDDIEE